MTTTTRQESSHGISSHLDALRAAVAGEVITPDDPRYDEARRIKVLSYDPHPVAIVYATSTQDVAEAVRFARRHDFPLTVRSGGHSIPGYSSVDGALLLDLGEMRGVAIDPEARTARVQPAVRSIELGGQAAAYGLALTTGDTGSVAVGGLTVGGGIGYMVRKFGLTIDNLLSAEVVTADGEVVTASETEHPDLFWALRGGGGNFGIVTEFRYRLGQVPQVLGGALVLPPTPEVVKKWRELAAQAPEELTMLGHLMHMPPAPFVPEDKLGQLGFLILTVWAGDIEEGERVLAPFRALAEPMIDTVAPMPYPEMYQYMELAEMPHFLSLRSMFTNELPDESIEALIESARTATSPMSIIQLRVLGGAMARVPKESTAFVHRDKELMVSVIAIWLDPNEDGDTHRAWTANAWAALQPHSEGVYSNFLEREGEARIREAYSEQTMRRLAEVKRRYDPDNFFRFNQNIRPKA